MTTDDLIVEKLKHSEDSVLALFSILRSENVIRKDRDKIPLKSI